MTLVAALAGMTAWFARYFTGDVPDDWDLDLARPATAAELVDQEFERLREAGF